MKLENQNSCQLMKRCKKKRMRSPLIKSNASPNSHAKKQIATKRNQRKRRKKRERKKKMVTMMNLKLKKKKNQQKNKK